MDLSGIGWAYKSEAEGRQFGIWDYRCRVTVTTPNKVQYST